MPNEEKPKATRTRKPKQLVAEKIPMTWSEFVETLPLTLREKLEGTSAKAIDTMTYVSDRYAGTYLVVVGLDDVLTMEDRRTLVDAAATWWLRRFSSKRYRGLVFLDEKMVAGVISSGVKMVAVDPGHTLTSIERYENA